MVTLEVGIGVRMGLELDGGGDWCGSAFQDGGGMWGWMKVEQILPRLALSGILAGVIGEISGPEYHKNWEDSLLPLSLPSVWNELGWRKQGTGLPLPLVKLKKTG